MPTLLARHGRKLWLLATLALFALLASYQLGLPGLHYDEAGEAGVNAMQLLTSGATTAFRGATLPLFGRDLPLMVQDYIGALNVYLALPFLWLTGIGVPNLRFLAVLTGVASLLTLERAISVWVADSELRVAGSEDSDSTRFATRNSLPATRNPVPISLPALFALTLLAASPSFVFWSRQGIFVTNLTQPLCFGCIWLGLRWLRGGRARALVGSALLGGLALYAKLLAVWIVGPFAILSAGWWLWRRWTNAPRPSLSPRLMVSAAATFLLPLLPLLIFNLQTGGTLTSFGSNLGESYYGVDNRDLLANLPVRLRQLAQTLCGDHLWYLGGLHANRLAPWAALLTTVAALGLGGRRALRTVGSPLALLALAVIASLFTVSDLFITHYALLHLLAVAVAAIGLDELRITVKDWIHHELGLHNLHSLFFILLLIWFAFDFAATLNYHASLSSSGGLSDHSDASYDLAYYLEYNGLGAPIVLDWGMGATVRYLSEGAVAPVEIFGYESLTQPGDDFMQQLDTFLPNPTNVYLLRAPEQAVYAGRREAFVEGALALGREPERVETFTQRDGTPLYELWRVPTE